MNRLLQNVLMASMVVAVIGTGMALVHARRGDAPKTEAKQPAAVEAGAADDSADSAEAKPGKNKAKKAGKGDTMQGVNVIVNTNVKVNLNVDVSLFSKNKFSRKTTEPKKAEEKRPRAVKAEADE